MKIKFFISFVFALMFIPLIASASDSIKNNAWEYHGNMELECSYDNNINNAVGNAIVNDGCTGLMANFFMQRYLNKEIFIELSSGVLCNYYFDRNSLNWNNVDIMTKMTYSINENWFVELRTRGLHLYQPNVLNDADELIGLNFTGDFSRFEYTINPIITYVISDVSSIELSDVFIEEKFKKISGKIDYDNCVNDIHLAGKHSIDKWSFEVVGSYRQRNYVHMYPFTNVGLLETSGKHKKLCNWEASVHVGYDFYKYETHLIYTYKYRDDCHQGYDSYDFNKIIFVVPYKWKDDASIITAFSISYNYQKFSGRFVNNATTNPKVHYSICEFAINPVWNIYENTKLIGGISYKKRNTNVHADTLDREYSRFICELGVSYIF